MYYLLHNINENKSPLYQIPNKISKNKIMLQRHIFLYFLPSHIYHVKTRLWMIMMESRIVMV
jgi:hypothetical protein